MFWNNKQQLLELKEENKKLSEDNHRFQGALNALQERFTELQNQLEDFFAPSKNDSAIKVITRNDNVNSDQPASSSEVTKYLDILNEEERKTCGEILRGYGWGFTMKSDQNDPANIPFWVLPLDNEPFFRQHMFDLIGKATGRKFELLQVYCNGQTYGQDGCPHIDNVLGETHTFLYYANEDWNITSGGQTVFFINNERLAVDPLPNTAILFSTDLTHFGQAFNQFCRDVRLTVCYKLKEITD